MAKCILQLYRTRIRTTSTKNVRCRRVEILTPPICYETRDAKIKTKFVCSHAFYYDLRVNKLHTYYTRTRVAPSFRRPSICSYIIIKQIRRDINLDDVKIRRLRDPCKNRIRIRPSSYAVTFVWIRNTMRPVRIRIEKRKKSVWKLFFALFSNADTRPNLSARPRRKYIINKLTRWVLSCKIFTVLTSPSIISFIEFTIFLELFFRT